MEESRIDALDFVLNILREHEKSLDRLIERLDVTIQALSETQYRLETLCQQIEERTLV
jgi:hypothetical protein